MNKIEENVDWFELPRSFEKLRYTSDGKRIPSESTHAIFSPAKSIEKEIHKKTILFMQVHIITLQHNNH